MDNAKTGDLIREKRKEKAMTQKDLADKLHITDRAVSKWERGLCAPDISLLEPLSEILDISVSELVTGERASTKEEPSAQSELCVKQTIRYCEKDMARKAKALKKKTAVIILFVSALLILLFPTVNTFITGDGFSWYCVPACFAAEGTARAIKNYDEKKIEANVRGGEAFYDELIKLQEQGVLILDAKVKPFSVKLEDMFLLFEMEFTVAYKDIKYLLNCSGTYRHGKIELMSIVSPYVGQEYPEWVLELSEVFANTYDPG